MCLWQINTIYSMINFPYITEGCFRILLHFSSPFPDIFPTFESELDISESEVTDIGNSFELTALNRKIVLSWRLPCFRFLYAPSVARMLHRFNIGIYCNRTAAKCTIIDRSSPARSIIFSTVNTCIILENWLLFLYLSGLAAQRLC